MSRRNDKEINMIYDKNPYCTWCGVKMAFYKDIKRGQRTPEDAVTVDHLYPITDERRLWHKQHHIPSPVVLCCNKCNQERGNKSPEQMEIEKSKPRTEWVILFCNGNSQFQTT